jgi:subtilisin family serine protease
MAATATSVAFGAPASADPVPEAPKEAPADTLGAHDMDLLAEARAKHDRTVMLIVATDKGEAGDVAKALEALGGDIAKRHDRVGYVRAQVPIDAVLRAAKISGVAAIDLDEVIPMPKPDPSEPARSLKKAAAAVAAPGAGTPAVNPYMPTHETGAVAFKEAHPTWDGRGVTIGIMDSGVDLDNPALQTTSTGERKIVDWFTATDPVFDSDFTWRLMLTQVTGPSFTAAGGTWTAPGAGPYRFSRFNEAITAASSPGGDVNRDGDQTDLFGVLYDKATNDIWVDVNQDLNFTNDGGPMRPYAEDFQVGHFGTDNPATDVREQMPFVVQFREDVDVTPLGLPGVEDFVNIGIIEDEHGSHVAGITAANDMFGNPDLDGAAPGAKLVAARACNWGGGCTAAALTDGMVELVTNRGVDVVNMSIGGLPALNDGNNARAELYNRLIDDYGVQIVLSAGNSGPGLNTVGDPAVVDNAISAAASISKETWLSNYGSVTRVPYQLFNFSSRGPAEDGGNKPTVSAPGSAISTTPLWQPGVPVPEAGYPLPPGYQMINGTSMAAPQTAGGVALLLSAAKATDKGLTPAAIRRAVSSSADWIKGASAAGQGNGLLDIPGAWNLLKGKPLEIRGYTVDAPVCTAISDFLATPDRGIGIYNRCAVGEGGLRAGQTRTYAVRITRTSGPAGTVRHDLKWLGNDGTFSSARRVDLPLNRAVRVDVTVEASDGAHSAILRVDDPRTPAVDHEMLNTIVVSNAPRRPGYSYSTSGTVDRNLYKSFFVTVPEGAAALQVNLSGIATGSQTRFIAFNPWGVPVESTSSLNCYTNFSDPATCKPQERSYENPLPGVWEIEVESRRTSPALVNPFNLTARIQGVTVEPATVELPSVEAGVPSPVSWTVTNNFGPVTVSGEGGPLGSAFVQRPTIANEEEQTYAVAVPAGATSLDVSIGNTSDLAADLDLSVFNSAGVLVAQDADGDSEESVSIPNPPADTYTVVVDGYSVPAGTTAYDYRDVFYSPALGAVETSGAAVTLANGASATISGSVTALSVPAEGRQLFGEMRVVTDEGAVVGRGNVLIGTVTGG